MRVIVASKNPVKLGSSDKAFNRIFPKEQIEFITVETDSGVSEQPLKIEEARQGAINRAKNASQPDADYSVGIEGGLSFYEEEGEERGFEISWACVYDCKTGEWDIGSAPGFPVFRHVLKHVHEGKALSEAMEAEYGITNIGQQQGYIGWLTDNRITRESSNIDAVDLALSSLLKEARSDARA
jgi:inosine/xanthosine triphosphatase